MLHGRIAYPKAGDNESDINKQSENNDLDSKEQVKTNNTSHSDHHGASKIVATKS